MGNKKATTIVTVILTLLTMANVWALTLNARSYNERITLLNRIDALERNTVSSGDLKCMINEVMESQFNSFELRLQQKYKIIPKG